MLQRNIQPEFKPMQALNLVTPQCYKAECGTPIHILPVQDQEVVKIDFIFNAGEYFSEHPIVALSTLKMLQEGSSSRTSEEIAEKLDFLGAYLFCSMTKDYSTISLCCLEKHAKEAFEIVSDFILHPTFPEDKLAIHKSNRFEQFKIDSERVEIRSQRLLANTLFGSQHPYGKIMESTDFEYLTRENLISFHKENFTAEKTKIFVCANLQSAKAKDLLETIKHIQLPKSGKVQIPQYKIITSNSHSLRVPKEKAVQTALKIGKVMVNRNHPDFIKLQVVNTILGGYFGSRLMTTVREEKGYTYGIGSAIISLKESGYFIISSQVGKEVHEKALEAIFQELKRLRTELVSEEELNIVKTYMLSSLARSFDGAMATSEMLLDTVLYNLDFKDYYNQMWNTTNNIQPKEIQKLANTYLNEDSMYEVAVG
ncbi:MAG: insulinase family protein [Bacteroidales bacterium]|nr:insulinase family protein [Bacteroidales bacterium]